jgi:ADP-heptose:LPS heptosyltransferase
VINLCGQTDLPTLAGILAEAQLFVGNDGGVAQLAGILGVHSIVVFGPTSPAAWRPLGDQVRVLRRDIACSPCFYRYHELGTPAGCVTRECLMDLPAETVVEEAITLLNTSHGS